MRKFLMAGGGVVALALALSCSEAYAEGVAAQGDSAQPSAGSVAEVVVTARKREEKLFDVPGPVSAVTGQQVDSVRLNDARDLVTTIPTGFLQEVNAGTARDINIRGIGTPTLFAEPGVASYVDDVYSSGFISYPTQFYDLDRVEVLRGPQGGLYGRNAVGGAVNFIDHVPTPDFGGYVRASYGSWQRSEFEGMLNIPINDQSGLRLVGWRTDQLQGDYYNPYLHQYMDKNDSEGGRFVYNAHLTDKLTFNLIGETQKGDGPGTILYFPGIGETKKTVNRDTEPRNTFTVSRLAGKVDWDTEAGQVTLIAGYRNYDLHGIEDNDLSADPAAKSVVTRKNTVVSRYAELRWLSKDLGPVSILAGVSYLDDHGFGFVFGDSIGLSALLGAPATLTFSNDQSVQSWSPFVEATWHLTDTLSLIGDLRYTSDQKHENFAFIPSPAFTAVVSSFTYQALETTKTFTQTSPGVTLAWDPDPNWRLYSKVQTGFRAGGFNFNVANVKDLPYNSETSINYEVGVKRRIPGGYLAATGFRLDQDHTLLGEFDLTVPPTVASYLGNLGKARTYGLELEANFQPLPGLTINSNVGLLDAKLLSGTETFYGNLAGKELFTGRKVTAALMANYRHPITGDIDLLANGSYTYRAPGWADAANTVRADGERLLNATAGFDFRRRYQVLAYVQNALNSDPIIGFGGYKNGWGIIRAPGESAGVEVKVSF
jgi:iron complex outermembrane receptor protein